MHLLSQLHYTNLCRYLFKGFYELLFIVIVRYSLNRGQRLPAISLLYPDVNETRLPAFGTPGSIKERVYREKVSQASPGAYTTLSRVPYRSTGG